ncbi:hypothetical protein EJ07DRAFT_150725 [Lizonia empirigonia]|nr:hypothetical protein EJ07DRAFT_150725 [Lizonia empirigonia]
MLIQAGTPTSVLARIVGSFSNEERPLDGEIFRNILLNRRRHDELSENQWWAYINSSKPRDLRQFLKTPSLTAAFESLVDMPGLWAKVQLGTLQRLLSLKCDEEMIRYLKHVKRVWDNITRCGDIVLPYSVIDKITVEKLEGLCPRYSRLDRDTAQIQRVVLASSLLEEPTELVPKPSTTQLAKERQFGRSFESDLEDDKHHLFIPTIYQDQELDLVGVNLQFVQRDLFQSIFGLFRFQYDHFGELTLSTPAQEGSLSADIGKKRAANSIEELTRERRRSNKGSERYNNKIQLLSEEIASIARENATLQDENAKLRNYLCIPRSQQEADVDSQTSSDKAFFEQQLAEQLLAEQLQAEKRLAEQ